MRIPALACSLLLIAAAAVSAQPPMVVKSEADRVASIAKVKPAVVAVFARGGQGGGTGVLINKEGYALTNFHVVQPTGPTMQCGLADGVLYDGVVVGIDKVGDVALIKLLPKKVGDKVVFPNKEGEFPFAEMGNSDLVREGDWSIAMGNPFLVATDFTPTVTFGLVSGVHRYQPPAGIFLEYTDCIQIDTSINPGNSGGPLFNLKGEIIGINGRGSFDKRGRINSGVGYAISINQIKNFMGHLQAGIDTDHASLGALVRSEVEKVGIGRAKVTVVLEDSDVARRGLIEDDVVMSFAGRQITSDNHYKNIVGIFPRGWRLPLEYKRGDTQKEILVRLMGIQRKEINDGAAPPPDNKQPPKGKGGPQGEGAKFYEPKPGYANFYFNRQEKQRVFTAFKKISDLSKNTGDWNIEGTVRQLNAVANSPSLFEIKEKGATTTTTVKLGPFVDKLDEPVDNTKEARMVPRGSGGLAAAIYLWRTMLTAGEKGFTECVHGGMEPLYPPPGVGIGDKKWMDQRVDADVLNTVKGVYHTKWFFARSDQKLLGMEVRVGDLSDEPCEVYFSDYKEVNGRQLPHRIQVFHKDVHYGTFTITKHDLK
ncbi:MAG: trypsin-like peptidase domain-containing protein [Planctomycetes bacterium]|nr:trypsin-like peptidase domain-containing protein [Planctomycetota bacterium]